MLLSLGSKFEKDSSKHNLLYFLVNWLGASIEITASSIEVAIIFDH
jgi:hypothetical protein